MNALESLLKQKNMTIYQLSVEYGRRESPDLAPKELSRKYGSMVRKALRDPDHTKHATVKRLIEILGGELVVKVKREEELAI